MILTALWVRRRRDHPSAGRFVRELRGPDDDPILSLTTYEARRLGMELLAAADQLNPPRPGTGGRPPFGWAARPRGQLMPDLAEQHVLDLIVEHVLDGYTRPESARTLNALGHTTRNGTQWTRDALRQLQNRLAREGQLAEPVTRPAANPDPDPELPLSG